MREGIARTGRPITNAALIMIVVFVAFGVTGPIPPTELGITLALAVLLDATVIRMMLVPVAPRTARRARLVAPPLAGEATTACPLLPLNPPLASHRHQDAISRYPGRYQPTRIPERGR